MTMKNASVQVEGSIAMITGEMTGVDVHSVYKSPIK